MTQQRGERLYVEVSASEARRRLKGHGFGVRRVESAGKGRAAIVHTATGLHLRQLQALFGSAVAASPGEEQPAPPETETPEHN